VKIVMKRAETWIRNQDIKEVNFLCHKSSQQLLIAVVNMTWIV
jgi:hypothetical protein